jgi:prepilin peptidase CpaA
MPVALKALLLAAVILAAAFDLRYRRIPNWLNLSAILLGVAANGLLFHIHGLLFSLLGVGCSLLIYVPLYLLRGMGAGDVKLMAAVASIVGPWNWLWIFLATALLGGLVSLIYVVLRRRVHQTFLNLALVLTELGRVRVPAVCDSRLDIRDPAALRMPHGAVIAAGAGAFLLFGPSLLSSLY